MVVLSKCIIQETKMNVIHAEIDREMKEYATYEDTGNLINGEPEYTPDNKDEELEDELV